MKDHNLKCPSDNCPEDFLELKLSLLNDRMDLSILAKVCTSFWMVVLCEMSRFIVIMPSLGEKMVSTMCKGG